MTHLIFFATLFFWLGLAAYFAWRFWLRRKPQSAVIASACTGWPVALARELYGLPRWATTPLICAAFVLGLLGFIIVFHYETHRWGPRP